MFPLNDMLGVLTPGTSEYDLIWRQGLYTGKGRSRVCFLIQYDQCPHRGGNLDTETGTRGDCHVAMKEESWAMLLKAEMWQR